VHTYHSHLTTHIKTTHTQQTHATDLRTQNCVFLNFLPLWGFDDRNILAPNHLCKQWIQEMQEFKPPLKVFGFFSLPPLSLFFYTFSSCFSSSKKFTLNTIEQKQNFSFFYPFLLAVGTSHYYKNATQ
jgi:hypothetical protein